MMDLDTIRNNNEILSYRHRDSLVACFADGHVDTITQAAMEEQNSVYKWNYKEAVEDLVDQ
jgi:prepilin-type processing-associated H-X9-DG protein